MKRIGFWKSDQIIKVGTFQGDLAPFQQKLEHLKDNADSQVKKGVSKCRFCQKDLFVTEYTWKDFVFPESLIHYIKEHQVGIPKGFYQAVMNE